MRKPAVAPLAAKKAPLPAGHGDAPVEIVCVALALALLVLVSRIASIW